MKVSEAINLRLQEAIKKKKDASERELSYWSGVVSGLSSAYDVSRINEINNN